MVGGGGENGQGGGGKVPVEKKAGRQDAWSLEGGGGGGDVWGLYRS